MKRADGEEGERAVTFSDGGCCQHCGESAATIPVCTDKGDAVDICQACVIAAFKLASEDFPHDSGN